MSKQREAIAWLGLSILAIVCIAWAYPQLYPLSPDPWSSSRSEARSLALERFGKLGEPVENPYVVVDLRDDVLLDKRLVEEHGEGRLEADDARPLTDQIRTWRVTVYEPGARPNAWKYRALVSLPGELVALELRLPEEEARDPLDEALARERADAFLVDMGMSLAEYGEPDLRRTDRQARTDLAVRYPARAQVLGESAPYGMEVTFAGDQLTGFRPWREDPDRLRQIEALEVLGLFNTMWITMPFLLLPLVGFFFLRKYHEGEIGVRRGVHVFLIAWGCGVGTMLLSAKHASEGMSFSTLDRAQVPWGWGFQMSVLWFFILGLVAALSWSVGEARCREVWGHKLAAFDALFKRRWKNGTVADSAWRGLAAGPVLAALLLLGALATGSLGGSHGITNQLGPWWHNSPWPGLAGAFLVLSIRLYSDLFSWLFLLPVAVRRFGPWLGGTLVAVFTGLIILPAVVVDPVSWLLVLNILRSAVTIALFLRYDLLTALLGALGGTYLLDILPFLVADHPFLVFQGMLPLLAVALPFLLSFRHLGSENRFQYRYEDVPPHVRRIAERERQRVELETARGIQSSILPDLPPQLAGFELAHAYLPASEVGGDFYDVLDLEDGRLALAVGDVAGHGVSSGLVMSMAKSTLSLQVTVNPEAEVVMDTLNRMVYRSARLRLLTTLCYALVDREQLTYASAGHLAPYRIDADGKVEGLSAASYPLGVRDRLDVQVRRVNLSSGDCVFLYSDGVVEACPEGSDEPFGFERLEASLARHADRGPAGLRDGVLADLRAFTGKTPQEDDQTILVVKVP